jgi:hypothetical protein
VHVLLALANPLLAEGGNRVTAANEIRMRLGGELRRVIRDALLPSTVGNLALVHMDPRLFVKSFFQARVPPVPAKEKWNTRPTASP